MEARGHLSKNRGGHMDQQAVVDWVERYMRAWASNDPQEIGDLFSEDALYYTAPFRSPWRSRQGIVEGWLGRKDDPGSWEFEYEVLSACDGLGVVKGRTNYVRQGREYSNLWTVRLDSQGRCTEFMEWWMLVQ
jgi:hypothetical protein